MKKTFEDVENYQGDFGRRHGHQPEPWESGEAEHQAAGSRDLPDPLKTDRGTKLLVKTVEGQDGLRA